MKESISKLKENEEKVLWQLEDEREKCKGLLIEKN